MPIPSTMADLSTTASINSPAGGDSPIVADDHIRALGAIVRTTNAKGSDIASASSINLGAATGEFVDVTGTTTITSLGTVAAGIVRTVRFTGALTLTHNATSLILPTSANITTANGDVAMFRSLGSGNWKCVSYIKQNGTALALPSSVVTLTETQTLTNKTLTSPVITASTATVATDDKVLILDTNDSDNIKTVTAQSIADLAAGITSGSAAATTSGTSIDFTSIPSGVKKITLMLDGVSVSGASPIMIQIGDSGGVETSGYNGAASQIVTTVASAVHSAGFRLSVTSAATYLHYGKAEITLLDSSTNTWAMSGAFGITVLTGMFISGGSKALSATLDRVRLTTINGTDTFDAGSVNILYE